MNLLETAGLTKHFGKLTAVHRLDMQVAPREVKAIIGPNGAGKTTLFHLITGKLAPSAGRVHFSGECITAWAPHAIAQRGVARSFQLINIFPNLTASENMRLAVQARHRQRGALFTATDGLHDVQRRAEEMLGWIGLLDYAECPARNLSYGDQRRMEIGLAVATAPDLLLLDEPTSGMSSLETQQMIELIRRISKSITVMLIEHHMDVVMALANTILVMHYGEKIAEGKPEEISADRRVQEAYLGGL